MGVEVLQGDCREVLRDFDDDSVDSCVCDPPYHLASIVKRFGKDGSAPTRDGDVYARSSRGFMGKQWDGGDVAFQAETWDEVLRVLKPGGHLLSFGGTRTYHRMACAIEDAGFEIREGFDCVLIEREDEYVADIKARLAHISGADCPLFSEVKE